MCNLKRGTDVKTEGDLQNLITGIILRQYGEPPKPKEGVVKSHGDDMER